MYAISNASRVYITIIFLLCAAFFLAPSVVNASEYWSTQEKRMISQSEVSNRVNRILSQSTSIPSNATLSTVPSAPTISKNAAGGLSATTNNILKTLDQPSNFSSTLNNSASSAKTALKSCVRSPACATRALGTAGILYEGIQGWKSVYELLVEEKPEGVFITQRTDELMGLPEYEDKNASSYRTQIVFTNHFSKKNGATGCELRSGYTQISCIESEDYYTYKACITSLGTANLVGFIQPSTCEYANDSPPPTEYVYKPVTPQELDDFIDEGYTPQVSDAPIVLLSGEPETISLTTPDSANLPSTTTTSTDSQGKTSTTVKNSVITYNILNNNSSNPSIESTITEISNTYDDTANLVGSMTSTTTNNAVVPDPLPPSSSSAGASVDFELPVFCTWAKPLCDWLGWTQEELGEEEPDLSQLITVFEPDEDGFDLGIGSGSCPAPMSLNLGIINRTVEVSYQPFCDFLDMIRPFVLAAAYLFAAYLYVGVLRRG